MTCNQDAILSPDSAFNVAQIGSRMAVSDPSHSDEAGHSCGRKGRQGVILARAAMGTPAHTPHAKQGSCSCGQHACCCCVTGSLRRQSSRWSIHTRAHAHTSIHASSARAHAHKQSYMYESICLYRIDISNDVRWPRECICPKPSLTASANHTRYCVRMGEPGRVDRDTRWATRGVPTQWPPVGSQRLEYTAWWNLQRA